VEPFSLNELILLAVVDVEFAAIDEQMEVMHR